MFERRAIFLLLIKQIGDSSKIVFLKGQRIMFEKKSVCVRAEVIELGF